MEKEQILKIIAESPDAKDIVNAWLKFEYTEMFVISGFILFVILLIFILMVLSQKN